MSAAAISSDFLPPFQASVRPGAFNDNSRTRTAPGPALEFVVGDLTREASDAIVNPAGAGLVDLAIRRAAGPELLEAFHQSASKLPTGKLSPGHAISTPGFDLSAGRVIHVDPPVYADDAVAAAKNLASAHTEALRLAREQRLTSISFPAIGTGIHRYPPALAAKIAVGTVATELRAHAAPLAVRFVLSTPAMLELYAGAARAHFSEAPRQTDRGIVFSASHRG
ncbi:MAG TPA: macro domain-containing protein [Polyangia bacterium]|nr:macro domain-containing protein [Polyangia bacterium]